MTPPAERSVIVIRLWALHKAQTLACGAFGPLLVQIAATPRHRGGNGYFLEALTVPAAVRTFDWVDHAANLKLRSSPAVLSRYPFSTSWVMR